MDTIQIEPWQVQCRQQHNTSKWVQHTVCGNKVRLNSIRQAMERSSRASRSFSLGLEEGQLHTPYLCPHCGYYHLTSKKRSFESHKYLVIYRLKPEKIYLSSTPLSSKAKSAWNSRRKSDVNDEVSNQLVEKSGFLEITGEKRSRLDIAWLNQAVVTPIDIALFYEIRQKVPQVLGFLRVTPGRPIQIANLSNLK